jgi:hypothetical protein
MIALYKTRYCTSISVGILLILAPVGNHTSLSNNRNSTQGVYKLERRYCCHVMYGNVLIRYSQRLELCSSVASIHLSIHPPPLPPFNIYNEN